MSTIQSVEFRIGAEDAGCRLDEFLASHFGGLSRIRLVNLIKAGACTVNGSIAPAGWRLGSGELVAITIDTAVPTGMFPEPLALDILYEDAAIVVVVKPAGMLVHPNKATKRGTLVNALAFHLNRAYYDSSDFKGIAEGRSGNVPARHDLFSAMSRPAPGEAHGLIRPGLVHRLDRGTSGVMVIAKTQKALSRLSRHFLRGLIKKTYVALVYGNLAEDAGVWQAPIARQGDRQPHWWVTEDGKVSVTNFTVKERFRRTTLLELEPVTGRTNQLRIHAAYFGHPIMGDELYGTSALQRSDPGLQSRESGTGGCDIPLCLHAWLLALHHPESGEWMEFVAPFPHGFAELVDRQREAGT